MIRCFRLVVSLAVVLALSHAVSAQNGVVGRVVDTSGQPMPGVTVTMMPASGGEPRRTTTAGDGAYRFDKVLDGTYRIDFELRGFDVTRRNFVEVRNGSAPFADATSEGNERGHGPRVPRSVLAIAARGPVTVVGIAGR